MTMNANKANGAHFTASAHINVTLVVGSNLDIGRELEATLYSLAIGLSSVSPLLPHVSLSRLVTI